jgi:hypothetical protein
MKVVLRHINCEDVDCRTCLADHLALGEELARLTNNQREDHLGRYEMFLRKILKIETQTEWGWATQESFDEKNIEQYVNYILKE